MSFLLSDSAKRALLQGPGAADPDCPVKNGRLHYDAIRIEEYTRARGLRVVFLFAGQEVASVSAEDHQPVDTVNVCGLDGSLPLVLANQ